MPDFSAVTDLVPVSGLVGADRELFEAWVDVQARVERELLGDLASPWSATALREMERRPNQLRLGVAALDGRGTVVGAGGVVIPLRDNLRTAHGFVAVPAALRAGGIGSKLLEWVEAIAREHGRTRMQSETQHLPDGPDVAEGFLTAKGYAVGQVNLCSDLVLTATSAELTGLVDPGAADDGYVIETSVDGIPEEWLDGRAHLARRMSTDAPKGDLDLEEEDWDADRVRGDFDTSLAMRRRIVESVARHEATGELVGYTHVEVDPDEPELAFQGDTIVLREHRGHGLGMRLKVVNTLALRKAAPKVTRARTWNADDNSYMLAVNRRMGYRTVSVERAWQKRLTAPVALCS